MAHQRRPPRFGSKRMVEWVGPPEQGYVAVGSGASVILSSLSVEEPITLIRNRGAITIRPNAFVADVDIIGAIGLGVVSQEAFTAGIGSLPTPYSDADWGGWVVWRSFALHYEFVDGTGQGLIHLPLEIDSKVMRKVSSNEVLVYVGESQEGAFNVAECTRQLFKHA